MSKKPCIPFCQVFIKPVQRHQSMKAYTRSGHGHRGHRSNMILSAQCFMAFSTLLIILSFNVFKIISICSIFGSVPTSDVHKKNPYNTSYPTYLNIIRNKELNKNTPLFNTLGALCIKCLPCGYLNVYNVCHIVCIMNFSYDFRLAVSVKCCTCSSDSYRGNF